jgi:hypothetical protein
MADDGGVYSTGTVVAFFLTTQLPISEDRSRDNFLRVDKRGLE